MDIVLPIVHQTGSLYERLPETIILTILAGGLFAAAFFLLLNLSRNKFLRHNPLGIATIVLLCMSGLALFAQVYLDELVAWQIWAKAGIEIAAFVMAGIFILLSFESKLVIGVYRSLLVAKQQLEQQENWMRLLQEHMQDGLAVYSTSGQLLYINPAAEILLNLDKQKAGQKPNLILGLGYPDKAQIVEFEKKIAKKQTIDTQISLGESEQDSRVISVRLSPVYDTFNRVIGIAGSYRDVSQNHRLEKAKREFIQIASHELRTPLTAVRGYISLLKSAKYGSLTERQTSFVAKAEMAAERLSNLVDNLLLLAKIDENHLNLQKTYFKITDVVNTVIDELAGEAARRSITLSVNHRAPALEVFADKSKLAHIASNLVSNAIKYTPDGGSVTVQTGTQAENVTISVTDTGVGIAKEDLPKLFKKFERIQNERSVSVGGSGLGLVIVKSFAELHGGTVSVKSKLNSGTTFTVSLPIKPLHDALLVPPKLLPSQQAGA